MTLLRAAARLMLASSFIANGVSAVRQPDAQVEEAEAITEKLVPVTQRALPASVESYLPTDTRTWVRIVGGARIAGGVMLATGLGRRCGASILATSMVPRTVASSPLGTRGAPAPDFFASISLLGAAALAALDTEGKPSLAWRRKAKNNESKSATADKERAARASRTAKAKAKRAGKKAARAGAKAKHEAKVAMRRARDARS